MFRWLLICMLCMCIPCLVLSQGTIQIDSGYTWRAYTGTVAPQCPTKLCHNYNMVGSLNSFYTEFASWRGVDANSAAEFMNFRVMFPPGYNKNDTEKKYPVIVMLHGAGESGRIWTGRFNYSPTDPRYDNNSHNLLHGGTEHKDAVLRDPSHPRAFPGIVVFPQVNSSGSWSNAWDDGTPSTNQEFVYNFIEHLIENYNADINRIATHGLSNGAKGAWDTAMKRPDLFAAVLAFSGVPYNNDDASDILLTTPIRLYQGGTDTNPSKNASKGVIDAFVAKGGTPEYFLYPTLGHNVWSTAFATADFFSWILEQDKRKIYVFGGSTGLCDVPGVTKKLGFSAGFLKYQWMKDDVELLNDTTRYLTISSIGTYKVKFMREDGVWYESFPVTITLQGESTFSPELTNTGSLILPYTFDSGAGIGSTGQTKTILKAPEGFSQYTWYKDGAIVETNTSNTREISSNQGNASQAGVYAVSVKEGSGCESLISNTKTLVYNANALLANNPNGPWHTSPSGDFSGRPSIVTPATSENKLLITWSDNFSDEQYFEIWRYRRQGTEEPIYGVQNNWAMVGTAPANTTSYSDESGLRPLGEYSYYVRAMGNNDGRFSLETNPKRKTLDDFQAPTSPGDLQVVSVTNTTITVSWSASIDNDVVHRYEVFLGGNFVANSAVNDITGDQTDGDPAPELSYTFTGLEPNTTYMLNVRAKDFRGNYSAFPQAVTGTTTSSANGLSYKYYEGSSFGTNLPNFSSFTPKETGEVANVTLAPRDRDTNFAMVFEGYIDILESGPHNFGTKSDDGSKLFIGQTAEGPLTYVVNNDGGHGPQTRNGTYNFPAPGLYYIRLEYGQGGGGFELSWEYTTPSETLQPIPDSRLYIGAPTITHYYLDPSGDMKSTSNWGRNTTGGGTEPSNFAADNCYYHIRNRSEGAVLSGTWTVSGTSSRVIVDDDQTFTLNDNSALVGNLYANAGSTININTSTLPTFFDLHPTSTVNHNVSGLVPNAVYGNLNLKSPGNSKTLSSSSTVVKGNFVVDDQVVLVGNTSNQSTLSVEGDITFNGNSGVQPPDDTKYTLRLTGASMHTISTNQIDLSLYSLEIENGGTAQLNFNDEATPHTLTIGNALGSGGLLIGAGAQLLLDQNHLIVNGGAINPNSENGEISSNGSNITITSSVPQSSNIFFDETNNLINDLTVGVDNNQLTIATTSKVKNLVTVNSGTLRLSNSLSLISDASGTARIAPLLNGAEITGNVNFQRYMEPEGRIYRYLSSPVKNATVADIQQTIPVTGNFSGKSVIPGVNSGASMFHYVEPAYQAFPPNGGTNLDTLKRGKGYSIFIREELTPTTLQLTGTPYQGNTNFTLTSGSSDPNDGWNLLGNPYTAPIRWTGAQGTPWPSFQGIGQTIYVRENSGEEFYWRVYHPSIPPGENQLALANGEIAAGQAFWVQTTGSNPQLTVSENAKQTTDASDDFFRENSDDVKGVLELTLTNGALTDVTYILHDDSGTENYEKALDGFKNANSFFNLSTLSTDNIPLAVNVTPETFCEKETRINITNAPEGEYTLKVNGLESLRRIETVYLKDKFLNTSIEIIPGFTYTFNVTPDAASSGAARFSIIETPVVLTNQEIVVSSACESDPSITIVSPQENVTYQAFFNGAAVSKKLIGGGDSLTFSLDRKVLGYGQSMVNFIAGYSGCQSFTMDQSAIVTIDTLETPEIILKSGMMSTNIENADTYQWYFEGKAVVEITSGSFFPSESGNYLVKVNLGTCIKESLPFNYLVTDVSMYENNNFHAYPNPFNEKIIVSLPEGFKGSKAILHNLLGQIISVKEVDPYRTNEAELDFSDVRPGTYLLQLGVYRIKVIKKN